MVEKRDPQGTPEEDGPAGRRAGGTMVHINWTGLMERAGPDEDAEALAAEAGGRHPQKWCHGPLAAAESATRLAHASAFP